MFKKTILSTLVFALSFAVGWQVLGVWIEPGSAPPAGNLSTPINIGTTSQTKSGPLTVSNTLTATNIVTSNTMLLTPISAPTCDTGGKGKLYYDTTANKAYYCNGSSWEEMGGGGGWTDGGTSVYLTTSTDSVGIGTTSPTSILGLGGAEARTIQMERGTVANTAGFDLTIKAGGATSGATNKAGGDLILSSGIATGTGASGIGFRTVTAGATGTTDRTPAIQMVISGAGNVGIGTMSPGGKLDISGDLILRGMTVPVASSAGQGKIYFDSTANRFMVSENSGTFSPLIDYPAIFYNQYCYWSCQGSNSSGTPDSCSSTCNTMPACDSGDTDYGIQGVMTGGGVTTLGDSSNPSVPDRVYFNGYGYHYRLCGTAKPVYETSCCWRCHVSNTIDTPVSCTHACVPPDCNGSDTNLGTGNIAWGGSISVMGIIGGANRTLYAIGYGQTIRNCRKN